MLTTQPNGIFSDFETALRGYLEKLGCGLTVTDDLRCHDQPSLIYEVNGVPWPTTVLVHQTQRSLTWPEPEYRVRAWTTLPSELSDWSQGREGAINRYASFAALVTSARSADVGCQSLIDVDTIPLTAGIVAAACRHGATSITESVRKSLSGQTDGVESLSDWTDLDFERIHYDHAHLSIGHLAPRHWTLLTRQGELQLIGNHKNPYWHGGLLCLLRVHGGQTDLGNNEIPINKLNQVCLLLDDVPVFGAWCNDGDALCFVTFIPNFMKQLPQIDAHLVRWSMRRAASIEALLQVLSSEQQDS